jgi:cyclophilin family peptidyl-prolyl cis-trans isomerase
MLGGAEPLENRCLLAVNVLQPIPAQTLPEGSTQAVQIDLAGRFQVDDIAGTVVRVNVNAPGQTKQFHLELFDAAGPTRTTPEMAANFLRYVDDGSYAGTIIHRSVSNFVVQGGGFTAPTALSNQAGGAPGTLPTKGTVVDEIGNPNVRGTLAMAKPSDQGGTPVPNSATNQWFVNLTNNSFLNPNFSAFARVVGSGMTFVDSLAAVPVYKAASFYQNGALDELPLWQITGSDGQGNAVVHPADFVTITGMSRVQPVVHSIVGVGNPTLVAASIADGRLTLQPTGQGSGSTTVTVRATSVLDPNDFTETSFTVTTALAPVGPLTTIESAGSVTLARDTAGQLFANSQAIRFGGAHVNFNSMVSTGYTARAAENIGGTNRIVWQHTTGALHFWRLDASWNFVSSDSWRVLDSAAYRTTELTFGMDFDGNGFVGPALTSIESSGSVSLGRDAAGLLFANSQAIRFGGTHVNFNSMVSSGYTAVAAEPIGGVNTIAWRHTSGALHFWRLDAGWNFTSSDGFQRTGSANYFASETAFGMDFDSNGRIGA